MSLKARIPSGTLKLEAQIQRICTVEILCTYSYSYAGTLNSREAAQASKQWNVELKLGYADLDLEGMQRQSRQPDGRIDIDRYLKLLGRLRSRF